MSLLVLLFSILVHSDETDCKFTVNGKTYDLSSLKGKVATGKDAKIPAYHYNAAVCADMKDACADIMVGQYLRGVVYQMGGDPGEQSVCWDMLAKWDSVSAGPLDQSARKPDADGLTLSFQNGDPCRGSPRRTKMNMICDTNEIGSLSGYQDDSDSCLFVINFPTSYACSGGPDPKTTAPPKPTPTPGSWGINGTFAGNFTAIPETSSDSTTVTIQGNCDRMVAVTNGKDGTEIWDLSMDACSGAYATGTMKSHASSTQYLFNAYLLIDSEPFELEVVLTDVAFPHEVVGQVQATKMRSEIPAF